MTTFIYLWLYDRKILQTFQGQHETLEDMIVYQAMYGERGIWVRPKTMFEETIERDGKVIRRFEEITNEEAEAIS